MTSQRCLWCNALRRTVTTWRDHLVFNECGKVPDDVQVSSLIEYASTFAEVEFQRAVVKRFTANGWRCFHADRGRGRNGDWFTNSHEPGLPDWVFIRVPSILFLELKTEDGKPTIAQVRVIKDIQRCLVVGGYFARPSDAHTIDQLAKHGLSVKSA